MILCIRLPCNAVVVLLNYCDVSSRTKFSSKLSLCRSSLVAAALEIVAPTFHVEHYQLKNFPVIGERNFTSELDTEKM